MKALIFAAGLGTRLRPLTDRMPKALVPVRGVPMLQKVICRIADAGIVEFVVNSCYLKEQIRDFVQGWDSALKISISEEPGPEPLETGGGIKHAATLLGKGRFLIHNADILSDLDLKWFIGSDDQERLATLLVSDFPSERYLLFNDEMNLVGWTNVRTGEIKSPFPDLNPEKCHRYSFCGIHILSDEVFGMMEEWPDRFSIIDFYLAAAASHDIRGVVAPELKLIDIGSPEKLAEAELSGL